MRASPHSSSRVSASILSLSPLHHPGGTPPKVVALLSRSLRRSSESKRKLYIPSGSRFEEGPNLISTSPSLLPPQPHTPKAPSPSSPLQNQSSGRIRLQDAIFGLDPRRRSSPAGSKSRPFGLIYADDHPSPLLCISACELHRRRPILHQPPPPSSSSAASPAAVASSTSPAAVDAPAASLLIQTAGRNPLVAGRGCNHQWGPLIEASRGDFSGPSNLAGPRHLDHAGPFLLAVTLLADAPIQQTPLDSLLRCTPPSALRRPTRRAPNSSSLPPAPPTHTAGPAADFTLPPVRPTLPETTQSSGRSPFVKPRWNLEYRSDPVISSGRARDLNLVAYRV